MQVMTFEVIDNAGFVQPAGFSYVQFSKLDQLYCRAASEKILTYRTVDVDFDAGTASYTYYKSVAQRPYLQFLIRKVGPQATMFEVYEQGRGRIAKSGVFDRAYEKLRDEVERLSEGAR